MSWLCKHIWEIKDKHVEPSAFDRLAESGRGVKIDTFALDMAQRTYICIMVCTKCGAVDKTVEKC